MKPMLIEESTSQNIPENLETLVSSLDGSQTSNSSDKKDLLVVLLYVLMLETGFTPLNIGNFSFINSDHGFSVHKLKHFSSMPSNWKNADCNRYELSFILGRFAQYPCRLLVIPSSDILIISLLISNLSQERTTYAMAIQPEKYISNSSSSFIPSKFCNLKDLSLKFKNNLTHPVRSVILTKEGIMNASLLGLPDEVKIRIFKYTKVCDLLKLSAVCKDLYNISEDQGLWRYFLARDFRSNDVMDLVNQPGLSEVIIWKEEYIRVYTSHRLRRNYRKICLVDWSI